MEKITHLSFVRRARIAIATLATALLLIPAGLDAPPAAATGSVPGPVPSVRLTGTGANSVSLAWDAPWTDGGSAITDYRIDVRESGGQWRTAVDGVSSVRSATVTGIATGVDHEVRVAAINESGDGPATTLGALSTLEAKGSNVCGKVATNKWMCFGGAIREKSVSYGLYPNTTRSLVATDIVDFDGLCAVSASAGVICRSEASNRYGELGQGMVGGPDSTFVVPGLPAEIVSVTSLRSRVCVIDGDAQLWCWGKWTSTSAGTPMLNPVVVKRNVAQFEGSCLRFRDNTVECVNVNGEWSSIPNFPLITKLANDSDYTSSCGITTDKTVVCFDTVGKSFRTIAGWENVVDLVDGAALCALIADGSVKCFGNNTEGELGNGTKSSGYATALMPEPAIAIAAHRMWDYSSNKFTCAIGVSGAAYCWGDFVDRFSTRLTTSTVPLAVPAPQTTTVRSMPAPGAVSGLAQTGRSTNGVTVRWTAVPNTGQVPVDGYRLQWSTDNGQSWTAEDLPNTTTSWSSPRLPMNSSIQVFVAATNEAGEGASSATLVAETTYPPASPTSFREVSHTATSAVVRWVPSPDEDEPITGYRLQWRSADEGWRDVWSDASATSFNLTDLPTRSAIEIRIRAENAAGVSSWTSPVVVVTSGTGSQRVAVRDSYGSPVVGGRITWVTPTGSFQSALDYGLTSDGSVNFPIAPAGRVNVSLTEMVLPGGALATLETSVLFGAGRTPTVTFPAEPSRVHHVVRVTLPNGMPVVGATVASSQLEQFAAVGAATFETPEVVTSGVTNEFGEVYLVGYSDDSTTVDVEYNDGVLIQRLSGELGLADTEFQFEEMPWVDAAVDTVTTSVGQLVSIPVTAETDAATVRIIAPASAPQSCTGKRLSARVDAAGKATLKVCATASGTYKIAGTGAVSTGAVLVKVRGTKSLGVRNATAVSTAHKSATVTWTAPSFNGGKAITGYVVKLISPRGTTISKTVTSTRATFTGLSGATTYKVKIIPKTSLGNGKTVVTSVPVS